jgi:hypothetical protein
MPMGSRSGHGRTLPLLALCALAAGCEQARVTGEVLDALTGKPLEGALVKVQGTEFRATSRQDGRYAVPYAPGEVALEFEKPGFLPTRYLTGSDRKARLPAQPVRMYRLPPAPGLFGVDTASGAYRPLPSGTLCSSHERAWRGGGLYEPLTHYTVPSVGADAPRFAPGRVSFVLYRAGEVSPREEVPFLRRDTDEFELLKVEADGTVLQRALSRDLTRKIRPAARTDAGNGLWVLSYELPAGVYAFVNTHRRTPDQGLPFRVGTPSTEPASTCRPNP